MLWRDILSLMSTSLLFIFDIDKDACDPAASVQNWSQVIGVRCMLGRNAIWLVLSCWCVPKCSLDSRVHTDSKARCCNSSPPAAQLSLLTTNLNTLIPKQLTLCLRYTLSVYAWKSNPRVMLHPLPNLTKSKDECLLKPKKLHWKQKIQV